mmetsp:Transcript_137917/g.358313  ORF Transcript_137917/g.358313 Transcript_137917/m.358313 type:complete len:245 (-) Transcript_137917:75-809(-)
MIQFLRNAGCLGGCFTCLAAFCAIFGLYRCFKCRLRDFCCCRLLLRCLGVDRFAEFEVLIHVHEALYTSSKEIYTCVRLRVGNQRAMTDKDKRGQFDQHVSMFVEQGSETLEVDLMDRTTSLVLAKLELDLMREVILSEAPIKQQIYDMVSKSSSVQNPRVKLSLCKHDGDDEEDALLVRDLRDNPTMEEPERDKKTRERARRRNSSSDDLNDDTDSSLSRTWALVAILCVLAAGGCGFFLGKR